MDSIRSRILSALRKECFVSPEDRILAAVSGGIDSIFLLTLLHLLGQDVEAAVFDHGLRPESAEEAAFVTSYCRERGIPCFSGKADIRKYAAEKGLGIEEAARELRYRFLFDTAAERQTAAVATAHHANDQAETVLLHLLRGCSPDGLCGIRPYGLPNAFSGTIPLIRPLLGITRAEIEAYAAETGMPYREDRSNTDTAYTRNRIRLDLLPKLEGDYNPRIVQALCRLAETAAMDRDVLEKECDRAAGRMGLCFHENGAEWDRKTFTSLPEGLRLRLLSRIITAQDGAPSDIGYINLKESDDFFLNARYNQTIPFMSVLFLRCEGNKAEILKDVNVKQWEYPLLSRGWMLLQEIRTIGPEDLPGWMEQARTCPETAVLDADRVSGCPELRGIRPGERFDPYGMGGRKQKLSDFLINRKVPEHIRPDLAAAADEAGIIWIPGLRVSDRCALREHTRRIMILRLKK